MQGIMTAHEIPFLCDIHCRIADTIVETLNLLFLLPTDVDRKQFDSH